jgi:hypothetical protein
MSTFMEIEQEFWSRVWRCAHRQPCKRCCWPWLGKAGKARYDDPGQCCRGWYEGGVFNYHELPRLYGAHVFAYIAAHGGLLPLPGSAFAICHACDYQRCCNPPHLSLGSHADNARDRRGKNWEYRLRQFVWFPDGRQVFRHRIAWGQLRDTNITTTSRLARRPRRIFGPNARA